MAAVAHFGVPTDEEAGLIRGVVTGGVFRVSVMTAALVEISVAEICTCSFGTTG